MPDNKICKFRVGQGYDVHRLVTDRRLILGGVDIPYEKGLLGHSDADVLAHAIMDALLGAAALGDIGKLFPDNDPEYEGADSLMLTRRVARVLEENRYAISNVDATIIAQSPKLAPYIDKMRENIAGRAEYTGHRRQRQGDDRGKARLHRKRRGYRGTGGGAHIYGKR